MTKPRTTSVLMVKVDIQSLINSGYQGAVLVPVDEDLSAIQDGQEVAAKLSFSDKLIRTIKQNSSIHKYCDLLAKHFERGGLDMQTVLERAVPVVWTMEAVKEVIWRRIQVALFPDKTSTTQLDTKDVTKVYEQIARHMSTEFNINQSFPNRFGD